jgi:hypothetical protein
MLSSRNCSIRVLGMAALALTAWVCASLGPLGLRLRQAPVACVGAETARIHVAEQTQMLHRDGLDALASTFASDPPPWLAWARCWGRGRWRRMDERELAWKREHFYSDAVVTPAAMDNFTWAPAFSDGDRECETVGYAEFNRRHFCRLLDGRPVFLLGDSITRGMTAALIRLASAPRRGRGGRSTQKYQFRFPSTTPIYDNMTICEDVKPVSVALLNNWAEGKLPLAHELSRRRASDMCSVRKPNPEYKQPCHIDVEPGSPEDRVWGVDEFLVDWAAQRRLQAGLILINSGAHIMPDAQLYTRARAALTVALQAHPHATVMWRNTPVGHANCSLHKEPLAVPQPDPLPFTWSLFKQQNAGMMALLARDLPQVVYVDVASSGNLRADMHTSALARQPSNSDCLHYNGGRAGPMDHWWRTVYNLLRLRAGEPASQAPPGSPGGGVDTAE